jgi:hypothetical protein
VWAWLAALVSMTGMVACGAPAPPVEPPPVDGMSEPRATAEGSAPVAIEPQQKKAPWRVEIYRDTWPTLDATLLGVDLAHRRAFIKLRSRRPSRYAIDTIDIDTGKRLTRWEADGNSARHLADYDARYAPLDGDHGGDLSRLAGMVGTWSSRAQREGSAWPVADASADGKHVVYMREPAGGKQGDWLMLRDVDRGREIRIGQRTVASYDAKFSPDGEQLAWRGCVGRHPCRYFLFVSTLEAARRGVLPFRFPNVREPRGPLWSPDGKAVYVLATVHGERCVVRATPGSRKPWRRPAAKPVLCAPQLHAFALSPDGTALLSWERAGQDVELSWTELPAEGAVASDPEVRVQLRQTSDLSLSDAGLVLADHEKGLLALDLHGSRRRIHPSDDHSFVFVPNIQWLDGDTALMLEKSFGDHGVRLVRVDVGRFLRDG